MDPRLARHRPTEAAKRRAREAGLDLATLKRDDPERYRMLNAAEVVRASPELAGLAAGMLLAAFPEREAFRAPAGALERVLAFPPLDPDELRSYEALLAPLVERPEWRRRHAFYREVGDARGVVRELAVPTPPGENGANDAVVGPFASRQAAEAWGRAQVRPPRAFDAFVMGERWYCDVFRADTP